MDLGQLDATDGWEPFNGKPCIQNVIESCSVSPDVPIYVVLGIDNLNLKQFIIENHPNVILLFTQNNSMLTTYRAAFYADENDTVIVAGDLWNLKKENVEKFLNSVYKSAIYRVKTPWGKDLISRDGSLIRRGDIGDSVLLVANEHKDEYLSQDSISLAKNYFNKFYPHMEFDIDRGNHLWTWLDYTFFFKISSSRARQNDAGTDRGAIYIDTLVYLDND